MARELSIVLVRSAGRAPVTWRISAWSLIATLVVVVAVTAALVWVGFHVGELTYAL